MRFLIQPPKIIRKLFTQSIWRVETEKPSIYLTFDDGPIPELTPWILDVLKKYNVRATFFCVGDNVTKHNNIAERILHEGHRLGNHTNNHLKGWKTSNNLYFENIQICDSKIHSNLFRPPYGRLKISQYKNLKKDYKIIFWDVLSHDYSSKISPETCLNNSVKYTRKGSIIVFHDNIKAEKNLRYTLPLYIEHFLDLNYKFELL